MRIDTNDLGSATPQPTGIQGPPGWVLPIRGFSGDEFDDFDDEFDDDFDDEFDDDFEEEWDDLLEEEDQFDSDLTGPSAEDFAGPG